DMASRGSVIVENVEDGAAAGHIAPIGFELSPESGDLALDRAAVQLERLAQADDVRAGFGQGQGHGLADSPLAAGDESGLAIQLEQVESVHEQVTRIFITSPPLSSWRKAGASPSRGTTLVTRRSIGSRPAAAIAMAFSKSSGS